MSDATKAPAPDELVWAVSPTGRKKEIRQNRLDILALAGWKPTSKPTSKDQVVQSFPTLPDDHGATEQNGS